LQWLDVVKKRRSDRGGSGEMKFPSVKQNWHKIGTWKVTYLETALGAAWHDVRRLRWAERRRITAAASSDLRMGEAERRPDRGVEERGNHRGFPVCQAQAKLTVAKALAKVRRRWQNGKATMGGRRHYGWVSARAGRARM
jgi:hypothetical protein